MRIGRYYHTVRHLQWRQIYHQIRHRVRPFRPPGGPVEGRWSPKPGLPASPGRRPSHLGGGRFRFLHEVRDLGDPIDWTAPGASRLWQYQLHYFDCLRQPGLGTGEGLGLIRSWVERHPPGPAQVGWEPYPLSLRLVRWLRFLCDRELAPEAWLLESLCRQAQHLERRIEWHLLGNHLFANAKALWFAGACLGSPRWEETGRRLVLDQVKEQFDDEGGHFELSPMYHALLTEDLLDLCSLARTSENREGFDLLAQTASRALGWICRMQGLDGELPLLNDSAGGEAAPPGELLRYGEALGVVPPEPVSRPLAPGWSVSHASGYWIARSGKAELWFDTAPFGPDFLPGHSHCDLLSVLFSWNGRGVWIDTGVHAYAEGARRHYSRSTAAHNTFSLDGREQADIWKSFRMGRRARLQPSPPAEGLLRGMIRFPGSGSEHERTLVFHPRGFEVRDRMRAPGRHTFEGRFHFAPGLEIVKGSPDAFQVVFPGGNGNGSPGGEALRFETGEAPAEWIRTEYYPEFGLVMERESLKLRGSFEDQHETWIRCTFSS